MKLSHDDAGSGDPALVFIHGWCCDRSYFAPQAARFAATHRVVAIDQRGHGKSDRAADGDYSVGAFASDVAELITDLELTRPVLIGHSLGGVVSLATAAAHPSLIGGVVMVDPAPIIVSDTMRSLFASVGKLVATEDGRKQFVGGMFAPMDDSVRRQQIIDGMSSMPDDVAVAAIEGLVDFDGPAALRAVSALPVATIGSISPLNTQAEFREHNPNMLVAQTLGAGHFNQLEVPDQVNAMIEDFLRLLARG